MPEDDVIENYESGSPVKEIAENFGLKLQDICTILNYAATYNQRHSHPLDLSRIKFYRLKLRGAKQ